MTPTQYRTRIAALGLSQIKAAGVIGVTERTSRRYAANGVPEKISGWVEGKLNAFAAANTRKGETSAD